MDDDEFAGVAVEIDKLCKQIEAKDRALGLLAEEREGFKSAIRRKDVTIKEKDALIEKMTAAAFALLASLEIAEAAPSWDLLAPDHGQKEHNALRALLPEDLRARLARDILG